MGISLAPVDGFWRVLGGDGRAVGVDARVLGLAVGVDARVLGLAVGIDARVLR